MKNLFVLAGASLFVCACATADGGSQASSSAAAAGNFAAASTEEVAIAERENYDPNAIRCDRERVLGSRLPAREVCRPEWEWRAIARGAQETADHIQRLGMPDEPCDPC